MTPAETISALTAERARLRTIQCANTDELVRREKLVEAIDKRIKICHRELAIEAEFTANKKRIASITEARAIESAVIEQHETLKRELFDKYPQRPLHITDLLPDDRTRYETSRAAKDKARQGLQDAAEDERRLKQRQTELQADYNQLRESLTVRGHLPDTPADGVCIPCIQHAIDDFASKQRRQAGGQAIWPGQQHYGNCGIQSCVQIIAAATGVTLNERNILEGEIKDGNAQGQLGDLNKNTGGTSPMQRERILAKYGVDSDIEPTTRDNLAKAIKANKAVIANVDAGVLWNNSQYNGGGHAIVVYDGDFDSSGKLTHVYINDTGAGKQGRRMPIDQFMKAADALGRSRLNVPKNRSF